MHYTYILQSKKDRKLYAGSTTNLRLRFELLKSYFTGLMKVLPLIVLFVSANTARADITTGLVAHYAFDEGSGTTAGDSSGNNNTGTLTNGPTWTTGKIGGGLSFDGVNDYVSAPNSASLDIAGQALTVEFWANIVDANVDGVFLGKPWFPTSMTAPYYQYGVEFDGSAAKTVDFYFGGTDGQLHGPFSFKPPLGTWNHIAFTYDGVNVKGYLNGVQKISVPQTMPIQARGNPLRFGVDGALKQAYKGTLDEVRLYNRALTISDIQALYNLGSGSPSPTDTQAPTVSLTAPANGSTVSGTITVSATANDNVGVDGVQFKVDGINAGAEDTASPYSISWDTTGTSNGSHTLTATARDAAGNQTTSSAITITVNNVAPPADTQAPTAPSNLSATAQSSSQINLSWTASTDNIGVTGYRVERCQGSSCTTFTQIATPSINSYNDSGLSASTSYTYRVRAMDAAGNLSGYSSIATATTQSPPSGGTVLGNLAASMAPGTWAMLNKNGDASGYGTALLDACDGLHTILEWSGKAGWDPGTEQFMYVGQGHYSCLKFITYSAATNKWTWEPGPPWNCALTAPTSVCLGHAHDLNSSDPIHGYHFYYPISQLADRIVRRWHAATKTWSALPPLPQDPRYGTATISYFPDMGGLIVIHRLIGIWFNSDATGQWQQLSGVLPGLDANGLTSAYSAGAHAVLVTGSGSPIHYKIDATGTVTRMQDAPVNFGISCSTVVPDPVSGKYLVFAGNACGGASKSTAYSFWEYDIMADTWRQLWQTGQPNVPLLVQVSRDPVFYVAAAPVTNYGVTMYITFNYAQSQVLLYKHAVASPDATSPSVPLGLTATAVSSSQINLSWTASTDNIGVTGYRVYRCQGAGCTPTTQIASPSGTSYQDTGLAASTAYIYAVAAQDAAGNLSAKSGSMSAMTQAASFDFSLSSGGAKSVTQGQSVTNTVSAILVSGTSQSISFSASGLPSGATASFSPTACTPNCSTTLTLATAASTPVGTYTVTITGTGGGVSRSTTFTLTITTTTTSPPSGSADFQTRCSQPGVVKCVGFDAASDIAGSWGSNHGILPGATTPVLDSSVKASGNSSLEFIIPSNSGANTSGTYFTNFSDDLLTQFGEGEEFYIQWRQRFSPEFLNTVYQGSGGWKQDIIGEGDRTGVCDPAHPTSATCPTSCTQLEIVTQNTYLRGLPQMYHSCGGKDGRYEPLDISEGSKIMLQNAVDCAYTGGGSASYTEPPCDKYKPAQWMTFQVHVKIGTWYKNDGVYRKDSTIQLWVADEGQPSKLVIDRSPTSGTGYDIANNNSLAKYGKIWLLPYQTGKDPTQVHPTAYTWYDELIISRNKIADPGASTPPPTTLVGDLNNDRTVNGLDWSIMASQWFTADATADINNDGVVNSIDFSLMNANWGSVL